jgi:hypothetical protein
MKWRRCWEQFRASPTDYSYLVPKTHALSITNN